MNINQDTFKTIGHYGARIGKTIVFEGCKAVVVNAGKTIVQTGYEDGIDSVKNLGWNDFLSDKEARIYKKELKKEKAKYLKAENDKLKRQIAKLEKEAEGEV